MCNVKRRAKSSGVDSSSARTVTETATAYATVRALKCLEARAEEVRVISNSLGALYSMTSHSMMWR